MIYQLDSNFFLPVIDDDVIEKEYFSTVIDFISNHINAEFAYTADFYNQIIEKISDVTNGDSLYCYNTRTQDFYKLLNKSNYYITQNVTAKPFEIEGIDFSNNTKHIYETIFEYAKLTNVDCMFFLDIHNHNKCPNKQINNIYFINHIFKETCSNIGKFIEKRNPCIEKIIMPDSSNYLPNSFLCELYKTEMENKTSGLSPEAKISIFIEYFREVAARNGYTEDIVIEKLNNTSAIRIIYTSINNTNIHICADVENGAIEVCDRNGIWKGAFSYTGRCVTSQKDLTNSKKIKKHSIIVK